MLASPIFTTRWRWDASRALVLLRFQGGKKVPPQIQRMRADDLLAAVFPDAAACPENLEGEMQIPDHPLVREVMKDALTEAMDIDGLKDVLARILDGRIRCVAVDTPVPSQFSHEILNANPFAYLDDAPLEERRARAVEMRRVLPESVLSEVGRLDPAAIAEVREEAWPDVRDADELHDALLTLIAIPEIPAHDRGAEVRSAGESGPPGADLPVLRALQNSLGEWSGKFEALVGENRASRARISGRTYWVAAERAKTFAQIFSDASFDSQLVDVGCAAATREDAALAMVTGWAGHSGPVHARPLAGLLGISEKEIDAALLRLESSGAILRGRFTDSSSSEIEWCERRLLARIHRLTLGRLRKEIEPVTAAQYMRWLLRWQHVAPGTQVLGERGTLEIVRQLQGYEAPANAWERSILADRIAGYDPKILDHLCLTGAVGWGRISPHPAMLHDSAERKHRVVPTSIAPVTFFVRDDADWMLPHHRGASDDERRGLSPGARDVLHFLEERGASFFADIVRGTRKLKSEVETALWELVASGVITADGFDNLRALIDPKRRAGQGSGKSARPRHSSGRWSLLYSGAAGEHDAGLEAACWMLLRRYGVVFRELLARESVLPKWREVLIALRRLEDRGEIRGGRFVSGFLGEQFALPVALESLRASRSQAPTGEAISISAADPLNLAGIIVPGERVPAISGRYVTYRDGVAVETPVRESMADEIARVG